MRASDLGPSENQANFREGFFFLGGGGRGRLITGIYGVSVREERLVT